MLDNAIVDRIFKTSWFSKAARKAHISDSELLKAIRQVAEGKADDLGGGVFKKRLNDNMHRSIVLANAGHFWVFAYLFAKKIERISTKRNLQHLGHWQPCIEGSRNPTSKSN